MKKILTILVILFILLLSFQVISNIFKKEHNIKYSIINNKDSYKVEESFKTKDNYYFVIKDNKDHIYNFYYKNNFNKQDKIIRDIKKYSSNNIDCIIPIYKRDLYGNIYCSYKNNTYTYSYLKDNEFSIDKITKSIKKDGYYNKKLDESDKVVKKYSNNYYIGNVRDNYKFIMWNYTGLDIIDKDGLKRKTIYKKKDLYDNDYSTLVGKYYIVLDDNSTDKLLVYDIELEDKFSGEYNILGSYNNKLYLVDLDKYIEYEIDPYKDIVEIIGDEDIGYKGFKDSKLISVDTSEFKSNMDKYKINSLIDNSKIKKKFNTEEIYKIDNYYYFRSKDNTFYRSSVKYPEEPIRLFRLKEVSDFTIVEKNILVISDNMLYIYNDEVGLKKIIMNNEFRYKYKNMYNLYIY